MILRGRPGLAAQQHRGCSHDKPAVLVGQPATARRQRIVARSNTASEPTSTQQPVQPSSSERINPGVTTFDDDLQHQLEFYDWKWGSKISYVRAGRTGPPLLLVHGFGVGAYHFDRNIPELARNHKVYAIDLLGQGQSWPTQVQCQASGPLCYSADTWTEQLFHFIEEKIGQPVYIAGNSLGGFLACNLAAKHPDAVKGLVLLNATPFWSSRPPAGQEGLLWKLLPSTVPVPKVVKATIERYWWDKIRNPETIRGLLQLVYARPSTIDDSLLERIVQATQHPEALDAFTSIVLAPKTQLSFDEMLAAVSCPVCLAYGRDDPWVVPLWGQRLKRTLPQAQYLELAPAGHCPHHEAPTAINSIIGSWVSAVEAGRHQELELTQVGAATSYEEADGQVVTVSCLEGAPRNVFEKWDNAKWQLNKAWQQALQRAAGTRSSGATSA
ncbi:hypothetical protein OEZ85_010916 [Tetradesmus obliquus]|uniref:AB hydrolase-1 domain-containing protein n=1 Tax=Tetradesmus obliquus TaxID=3088 RepID=A0ABY8TP44_TETOB|nr:hypothetical protein OEZ85_010916 [Tetradesmus obliquus]